MKNMKNDAIEYNKGGDEIRVKTNWGDLVASVGYDFNYPEIFISLEARDKVDFTLAVVGQDGDALRTRIKEYLDEEDFTAGVGFTNNEIEEAIQEILEEN